MDEIRLLLLFKIKIIIIIIAKEKHNLSEKAHLTTV